MAVLGRTVAEQLFTDAASAVGQEVSIRGQTFRVSGVIESADPDQAEMAYVPYTALQDALGISYLHSIAVEAEQAGDATRIAAYRLPSTKNPRERSPLTLLTGPSRVEMPGEHSGAWIFHGFFRCRLAR